MILAPHQDDEVILCGLFLRRLVELGHQIFVVFMTNGDYEEKIGQIRLREALEVMRIYHIPREHIIFMGYANEYEENGPHIYNAAKNQTVFSQFGNGQTYGLPHHPEYYYKKTGHHHTYQRSNLVKDLYDIMMEILPDIIFATDVETHPDHKANSLFLDEILGRCFQEKLDFRPIVLKKPGYNSAWFGKKDYNVLNNPEAVYHYTKIYVNNQSSQFCNPYIRWKDCVRFPIDRYARTLFKEDNIVYQALKTYDSQNAIEHFDMLLNSDVVFWRRRTDSLTYQADIMATSGNADYLKDFKIIDSLDIKRKCADEWKVDKSIWKPSIADKKPVITIILKEQKVVSEIVIYQEFCPGSEILESAIILDGEETIKVGRLEKRKPTSIIFRPRKVTKIEYIIEKCSVAGIAPGITEIEVYQPRQRKAKHIKIMINRNFVYEYITDGRLNGRVQVYQIYDDASGEIVDDLSEYCVAITDIDGNVIDTNRYINKGWLCGTIDNVIKIRITDKNDVSLSDEIMLYKKQSMKNADILQLMGNGFGGQTIKAQALLDEKDYLHYLMKMYYLCKSRNERVKCGYLKAEFAVRFYHFMKKSEVTQQEKEEAKCFLISGEIRPGISRCISAYFGGIEKIEIRQSLKQAVYLIGTPDHYNMGDHIIAYATCAILKDMLPEAELIEISMDEFPSKLPYLQKNVRKDDILVLQGGGNMGNIYWRNERIRREVIKKFPTHRIIIFPETIHYTKDCEGDADFAVSQAIYAKASQLTICAREHASYGIMKQAYPYNRIILVPDIVCYLQPALQMERKFVKLFYRSDLERKVSGEIKDRVEKFLQSKGVDYEYRDMLRFQKGYVGSANRNRLVWDKIKEIASARLIVTDRLHAMILSVITATPCLVIAGYNHKIESTYYTWFETVPYIRLLEDSNNLEKDLEKLLDMEGQQSIHLRKEYRTLMKIIKGKI